jgi:hypothetical protein
MVWVVAWPLAAGPAANSIFHSNIPFTLRWLVTYFTTLQREGQVDSNYQQYVLQSVCPARFQHCVWQVCPASAVLISIKLISTALMIALISFIRQLL